MDSDSLDNLTKLYVWSEYIRTDIHTIHVCYLTAVTTDGKRVEMDVSLLSGRDQSDWDSRCDACHILSGSSVCETSSCNTTHHRPSALTYDFIYDQSLSIKKQQKTAVFIGLDRHERMWLNHFKKNHKQWNTQPLLEITEY